MDKKDVMGSFIHEEKYNTDGCREEIIKEKGWYVPQIHERKLDG